VFHLLRQQLCGSCLGRRVPPAALTRTLRYGTGAFIVVSVCPLQQLDEIVLAESLQLQIRHVDVSSSQLLYSLLYVKMVVFLHSWTGSDAFLLHFELPVVIFLLGLCPT
jgi:hypothetical protein